MLQMVNKHVEAGHVYFQSSLLGAKKFSEFLMKFGIVFSYV